MQFEIRLIEIIQKIRTPFLDQVMKLLTELGDKFFFIGVALLFYWFINKRESFKLVFIFILSAIGIVGIKNIAKRPRPFINNPELGVGSPTSGYSFPSGHAQNSAVIATTISKSYKIKWLNILLIALIIIVPFTRLYLGQHYLTDVIAGLIIGYLVTLIGLFIVDKMKDKENIYGLLLTVPLVLILVVISFTDFDYNNVKDFYVAVGGLTGFMIGYHVDKVYVKYEYRPKGLNILYRSLLGGVIVLIFYVGLKSLFGLIATENVYLDFIRYFLIAILGTGLMNFLFKKVNI
ncbi:MAG: phosphatase PAP2 family protein [Acholeplasmataceae bacterium]